MKSNNFRTYIGLRIKYIRILRRLSIVSVANLLKITSKQFQNYEKGKTDFSLSRLNEIAEILNVNITLLIRGYKNQKNFSEQDKIFLINYARIKNNDIRNALFGLIFELA